MKSGNWIIILSLVGGAILWAMSKTVPGVMTSFWQGMSQGSSIAGLILLSWSYVLAIRHPQLEAWFGGLDKVYKIHHLTGGVAFLLLLHHPLFLILNRLPNNSLALYLLPSTSISYTTGILALYLMIALIVLTLFVDLPYKLWKQTHEWMGAVILLGGIHSLLIVSDVSRYLPLKIYLLGLAGIGVLAFIYKRFLYYRTFSRNIYKTVSCEREGDILILTLQADSPREALKFLPGQYAFLAMPNDERDEHPFSLLRQEGEHIQFGIKIEGKFTRRLCELATGSPLIVRGPFGKFGEIASRAKEMVWIAGGIGVTPFVPMMQGLQDEQQVYFYLSGRNPAPEYIEKLVRYFEQAKRGLKANIVSSKNGRLTAKQILEQVPMTPKTIYCLCGPMPMMESLTQQLVALGVKRKRIIFEDFALK